MSRYAVLMCSVFVALTGCTKKDEAATPAADPQAAAKVAGPQEVNLAIWGNYLPEETQERFTKETGIKLKISNYASNEELLAKVQAGASGYDVAVPSDYMVGVLSKLDLLQGLDSGKIPNRGDVDPAFLKQGFDPENKFSLPYAWSTAGLAVNKDLYKGDLKTWKDLFTKKDLIGKISLLDDVREVTAAALKVNGYSVNTTNPEELKKAEATLKAARSHVKMFRSDMIDALLNKEVAVAHVYSVDALQAAAKSGGKIVYVIPEEGGTRAIDNMVILKSAKNVESAHKLINFLLSHDANLKFVSTIKGGPVLKSTKDSLSEELKSNTALFPPPTVLSKLEAIQDVGEATRLYDRLWTEVKSE
ncbi:MAG: spermidine/putrescine ABC transporter substrate-binding protein [Bdellovibrionota bacterium]